jgi:hypothetical protein
MKKTILGLMMMGLANAGSAFAGDGDNSVASPHVEAPADSIDSPTSLYDLLKSMDTFSTGSTGSTGK